jgi:hypothetical protein
MRASNMTRTLHGKIHGKTIELDEDLGVVDGQEVEVQVDPTELVSVGESG